ncbi:hypothetical protein [Ornithinibacillus xuwenensis]|uniref:Lipoprotein n=1 Tax=Ornithinibacillus xuwenensis TaxID=3144668 RepID=A0ABU9XJI1_9BACI
MSRKVVFIILTCLLFIVGCNSYSKYDDKEVAAIVRGEEITIGELRFLYPDEKIVDYLDGTIKARLAVQEAKKLNLDVSQELQEVQEIVIENSTYPFNEDNHESGNDFREFVDTQSKKLEMDPEEYYDRYFEITQETSIYLVAYLEELLGEPKMNVDYDAQANELLNDLVKENEKEIQILIK